MKNKDNLIIIFIFAGFLITAAAIFVWAQEKGAFSRQDLLQRSKEHYLAGERYYNEGDYARADEEFKEAQKLLDNLPQDEILVEVPKSEPPDSNKNKEDRKEEINFADYSKIALEFSKSGESEKAISYYLKAIEHLPDDADFHYNLAIEYLKLGMFDQAAEELQKVIQLNPKDKDAYYNLGVLYESYLIDLAQAKFYYTQYVKLAKGEADIDEVKARIRQIDKEIRLEKNKGF